MNIKNINNLKNDALNLENQIVFISAVAGAGKTTLIIEKTLKLIINNNSLNSILILTYTNEAVNEIKKRLVNRFYEWSHNLEILKKDIKMFHVEHFTKNNSYITKENLLKKLQNIISEKNDIKIQTIHALCLDFLKQFSFKYKFIKFNIINDEQKNIIINNIISYSKYQDIIKKANISKNDIFNRVFEYIKNTSYHYKYTNFFSDSKYNLNYQSILSNKRIKYIKSAVEKINISKILSCKNLISIYNKIISVINKNFYDISYKCYKYINIFFTKDCKIRKIINDIIINKNKYKECNEEKKLISLIENEIREISSLLSIVKKNINRIKNKKIHSISINIVKNYLEYKKINNIIEFDDIIFDFSNIISENNPESHYVLMKINEQFNHFILDESQDNSNFHWSILNKIFECIFHEKDKSIFIVGDMKQSIYSFQGAYPELFLLNKEFYKKMSLIYSIKYDYINWNYCFRISDNNLKFLDYYFNIYNLSDDILEKDKLSHISLSNNSISEIKII
jgi:ATP-dependent helicase/nuclease subunit A